MTRKEVAPGGHRAHTLSAPFFVQEHTIDTELSRDYPRVDPVVLHAMSWSAEFAVASVTPSVGATLRLLAAAARARAVVEIGTGLGVSGLWLLAGMRPDGVLTTVDVEPDHQAMAKQSFAAAGYSTSRTRLIAGGARTVLPRLADAAYDLVFVDGAMEDYPHCVSAAHRLLREGGVLVVHNALGGATSELAAHTVRELIAYARDAPEWTPALIPTGPGLLVATKNPA